MPLLASRGVASIKAFGAGSSTILTGNIQLLIVAGGGSVEVALSVYLDDFARTLGSRE